MNDLEYAIRDLANSCQLRRPITTARKLPSGVSLIELLIVVAIIGVLIQLALPAIENSRETARRTVCQNNLRQIGFAMLGHESSLGCLPTGGWGWGWIGDSDRGSGEDQPGSWSYQLLPYMEQDGVYNIGSGMTGEAKYDALTVLAATPVPLLYCPSRRLPRATPNSFGPVSHDGFDQGNLFWYNAKRADKLARMDYAANVGDKWVFWHEGPPPKEADAGKGFFTLVDLNDAPTVTIKDVTGVVIQRRPYRLREITDGLSKTYFAGEKWMLIDRYKTGRGLNDDQSCWNGDDWDTVASTEFQPKRDSLEKYEPKEGVRVPFGSAHPNGANMLCCDGSVQVIPYDVDGMSYRRKGNRRDGEVSDKTVP